MSAIALLALGIAACQAGSNGESRSPVQSTAGSASPAQSVSPTAPVSLPRPTDVPTDGTCEEGHVCLGVLNPGTDYSTTDFLPHVTFRVPDAGWENLVDGQGTFQLLPVAAPGDAIAFFREPRASGAGASAVGSTVDDLSTWLGANPMLEVTSPEAVTVGGAAGVWMKIRVAADAENQDPSCPVQVCVPFFKGLDPSPPVEWDWDWGSAGTEVQRLYLVSWTDGTVVAIFVDSLDGTSFDALVAQAEVILETVHFS
jgi:hypothetical protein